MDIYDEVLVNIWRTLARYGVRYIMIGGVATNLHGFNRATKDADFYFDDTPENRERLGDAFEELDIAPRDVMLRFQFVPGWSTLETDHRIQLDMMTAVKGLEDIGFDACYDMARIADIYDVKVPFLHINHLLRSKEAANRPKDQLDILELKRLEELRGEM